MKNLRNSVLFFLFLFSIAIFVANSSRSQNASSAGLDAASNKCLKIYNAVLAQMARALVTALDASPPLSELVSACSSTPLAVLGTPGAYCKGLDMIIDTICMGDPRALCLGGGKRMPAECDGAPGLNIDAASKACLDAYHDVMVSMIDNVTMDFNHRPNVNSLISVCKSTPLAGLGSQAGYCDGLLLTYKLQCSNYFPGEDDLGRSARCDQGFESIANFCRPTNDPKALTVAEEACSPARVNVYKRCNQLCDEGALVQSPSFCKRGCAADAADNMVCLIALYTSRLDSKKPHRAITTTSPTSGSARKSVTASPGVKSNNLDRFGLGPSFVTSDPSLPNQRGSVKAVQSGTAKAKTTTTLARPSSANSKQLNTDPKAQIIRPIDQIK